jgi:lipopolysaccharide/colanic/teichoic acid biosynthesis glycosyltransferase
MQVDVIPSVPNNESKHYLRVATTTDKQTALSFFYIGADNRSIKSLSEIFRSGFITESFEAAKKIIRSDRFNNQIDAIIIDIPYDPIGLRELQSCLKAKGVHYTTPVIYNAAELLNSNSTPVQDHLIDDIIDLHNWQYDFATKVSFLKKAKEHSLLAYNPELKIKTSNSFLKRAFDIAISVILLLITLPIFILVAIAIRLESRGPIFYNAKRAGRGFKVFSFYKFRTMEVNADKKIDALAHLNQYDANSAGPKFFKITNDPRVTRVGKFLRNTSLDELPQLLNVLKGDMSLVGNRPLPLYEASTLTTNEFVERFMAPAGMTGLWQIKKRGKTDMSTEERISLDISYARKSNLLYDLWIMANTPRALLQKTDV